MVALANLPFTVGCDVIGSIQGRPWQNRHYFYYGSGSPDAASLFALNNAVSTAWSTHLAALCNPLVKVTDINSVDLNDREGAIGRSHLATALVGTRTGTPLPVSVACVVSYQINLRYRGGHPRNYMPFGNVADVVNGRLWEETKLAEFNSALDAWFLLIDSTAVSGFTFQFASAQYFSGSHKTPTNPHPVPVPLVPPKHHIINGVAAHGRIDTQRRRLGREAV